MVKYFVTHPGAAHRDDLLACAIAMAYTGDLSGARDIHRREPTPEELDDPNVWVIDVGGRHEPALGNFDHHQLSREAAPTCALTLVLARFGLLTDAREALPWLGFSEMLDSKGPAAAYGSLGCADPQGVVHGDPFAGLAKTQSPVEGFVLRWFADAKSVCQPDAAHASMYCLHRLMVEIGRDILKTIREFADRQTELTAGVKVFVVGDHYNTGSGECDSSGRPLLGVEATVLDPGIVVVDARCISAKDKPVFGLEAWTRRHAPVTAVTITMDDRGGGFSLFRRSDNPRVDFSRIEGKPGVGFAHKGGFVAKVSKDADVSALIAAAMLPGG